MIIKHRPEDFIVQEQTTLPLGDGRYSYWLLRKRNMTTMEAVHAVARSMGIKKIGFAGTKDKVAVTEQYISIPFRQETVHFVHALCSIHFVGFGAVPLSLGNLDGNRFVIVVRDLANADVAKAAATMHGNTYRFCNLFGEQRFSSKNAEIGKLLLTKKYRDACNVLIQSNGEHEQLVQRALAAHPTDFIRALKTIPRKILLLYLHAYQSSLWNEYAPLLEQDTIPLLGFGSELSDAEEKIIVPIMQREGISLRDFINPSFPEITLEGDVRNKWCIATELAYEVADDDYFPGKRKMTLTFFLPKGSYATVLCRFLFA
ncbi:tRNA pseudouridine(13) synthase TruD [Candidatus Woesearchaeota archaeon]|nr:tRNA pseudouridine(13) synthase TruD [Candidatus Woesearchaeota archaeon]